MDAALDWCLREKKERFRSITVRSEWDETEILLRNIQYIEIKRHTAYIHTTERVIQTSRGMNALEAEINNPDFLRCHRSFLVNMRYIRRLDKRDFVIENGDLVPIGSSDAAATRQKVYGLDLSCSRGNPTTRWISFNRTYFGRPARRAAFLSGDTVDTETIIMRYSRH